PSRLRLPLLTGLARLDAPHDMSPTAGVLSPNGRQAAIGWLRFVYLVDVFDGHVVARRRLPGLAQRLDLAPDGSYRVDVWQTPTLTIAGCKLSADFTDLLDPGGSPFPLRDFLAPGSGLRDQLWREACALSPRFDTRIEVQIVNGSPPRLLFDLHPPKRELIALGFRQAGRTPSIGAPGTDPQETLVIEATMSKRGERLLKDRHLIECGPIDLVEGRIKSLRPGIRVAVLIKNGSPRGYRYTPFESVPPKEWSRLAKEAAAAQRTAALSEANPWTLAFLATARARAAEAGLGEARGLEELTKAAAESPHLDPRGRVELACFLDRHGFEDAADQALELALREVWAAGFLPTWAGYGDLDAGRLLADRVEECLVVDKNRQERATALARWRDALAPVLRDSTVARSGYRWRGGSYKATELGPRGPPLLPEALARKAPKKGVAGMNLRAVTRVDHALRLKAWFFIALCALLAVSIRRYSRHARRDLERIGKADGWARFTMWFQRPGARIRFAWPTYLTLNDKLALIALYLAFFGVFAVSEAGVEVLLAIRGAPPAMMAGLTDEREARGFLEAAAERSEGGLYAAAYRRVARGERGEGLGRLEGALVTLGETDPRALLLWAEATKPGAAIDKALTQLATLLSKEDLPRLELVRARISKDAVRIKTLEDELIKRDVTFAGWAWARARAQVDGKLSPGVLPAAPAPTASDRDQVLIGSTHWARRLPETWLLNMLAQRPAEDRERQLALIRQQHEGIGLARFHNSWFFLIPTTLVLLLASLFMPQVHPFEPLESDLRPSWAVRIWRVLLPGVTQHQRNRPLRGIFLVISFAYLMTAILDHFFHRGFALAGSSNSLTGNLTSIEVAHFTGEVSSSIAVVQLTHGVELILALVLVYGLHWFDLWSTQRKVYEAETRPDSEGPRYVVPVDSESGLPAPGPFDHTEQSLSQGEEPAPFEQTEFDPKGRSGERAQQTALDRLELPPEPLEATELGLERRPTEGAEPLEEGSSDTDSDAEPEFPDTQTQ
ncbi:MAG: hypothetical protein JKY65_20275, partial [Planctomycetes bacterium]|nr:hypothetical protein [Planctomycetota bacterium]